MSTYNGRRFLVQQLNSISQNDCGIEKVLYVRDDGSSDSTVDILNKYASDHDLKIILDKGENIGVARSFLKAINDCPCADFYAFCDQDDVWLDGKLTAAIGQIGMTNQPVLWCSNYQITDSNLNVLINSSFIKPIDNNLKAIFYNNIPGCTMVFNKTLIEELRKIKISEVRMHDIMAINVALLTGKVIFDDTPYVMYRQHSDNVLGYNHKKINFKKWFIDKIKLIKYKEKYSTSEYAHAILNAFGDKMTEEEKEEYILISKMNNSFIDRIKVLRKFYTKDKVGRTSISIRCKILFNLM